MQHISIQTEILKCNCRVRYKVPYMADQDINNHRKSCFPTSYHSAAELNSGRHFLPLTPSPHFSFSSNYRGSAYTVSFTEVFSSSIWVTYLWVTPVQVKYLKESFALHCCPEQSSWWHAGSISSHTPYRLPRHRKQIPLPSSGALSFPHKICCQRKGVQSFFPFTGGLVSFCYINGNCRCTTTQMLISSNSRKGCMHSGRKKYPSVHAILAFKGKCAVEKEGMIGEIKLKCRKKNISNRRELLPVLLAKMLSWCSVRIHRCTGSPADYPNPVLRFQRSCPATVALGNSAAQSSSDLGGSPVPCFPRLAGQPLRHSCSISRLSCQRVCGSFKGPGVKWGCRAALTATAEAPLVRVSQALCDKKHGSLFALTVQVVY